MSTKALKYLQSERDNENSSLYTLEDDNYAQDNSAIANRNIFELLANNDGEENEKVEISSGESEFSGKKKKKSRPISLMKSKKVLKHELQENFPYVIKHEISDSRAIIEGTSTLFVENRFLNPDEELKKLIGSNLFSKDKKKKSKNSFWLVTSPQNLSWIKNTGLTMDLVEKKSGLMFFKFVHNKSYQEIQKQFEKLMKSHDLFFITNFIQNHPCHLNALIQFCHLCLIREDRNMAYETIEKALCVCEHSLHPMFSFSRGICRLDYKLKENRAFYLVVFKRAILLQSKGCFRTSLELFKFLFSLCPETDPLGVLLCIDSIALKSAQYLFILQFVNKWKKEKNLLQLPNFAFSVSLALFHLSSNDDYFLEEADNQIQEAILMFPSFVSILFQKLSIDEPILKHRYFVSTCPKALQLLIDLYALRTCECWKEDVIVGWCKKNLLIVMKKLDEDINLAAQHSKLRNIRYKGIPRNIYRHLFMCDVTEIPYDLPNGLTKNDVKCYDPIPPKISAPESDQNRKNEDESASSLVLFLQSLLPSFTINSLPPSDDDTSNEVLPNGAIGGHINDNDNAI